MSTPPPLPFHCYPGQYQPVGRSFAAPVKGAKSNKALILLAIGSLAFALLMLGLLVVASLVGSATTVHGSSSESSSSSSSVRDTARENEVKRQRVAQELRDLRLNLATVVAEKANHRAKVEQYIMNHKMAVLAILAGAGGGELMINKDNEFSEDAEALGGVAVALALLYATANYEEVVEVARVLVGADTQQKQYDSRIAVLKSQIARLEAEV